MQARDVDRISDLPENIRDTILGCLPLRDAVRTSILSRSWRHSYIYLSKLVFNDTLVPWSRYSYPRTKLLAVIYQVLLLHRGPVTEFELSIPQVESCSEIDRFMRYLTWNAVETLTLEILNGGDYKLPSSFYSCLHLKHLTLLSCNFIPPPNFGGFSRLTSLKFYNVTFHPENFGSFISKCVQLESLLVESEVAYESFIIDAPRLKYLYLGGIINPIRFKSAPRLEVLEIFPKELGGVSDIEFLQCLPRLEVMKTNYLFLKSLAGSCVPVKHLSISIPLKVLEIADICFTELDEVSCALDIIKSSTELQKLVFKLHNSAGAIDDHVLEYLKAQDYSEFNLNQLRKVKIERVQGQEEETEFVKLLLATCPTILEEILIVPDLRNIAAKGLAKLNIYYNFSVHLGKQISLLKIQH